MSMRELLEDAAATPSEPLDVTGVWEAGRRRRVRAHLGTAIAAVVVAGAVVTAGVSVLPDRPTVGIQSAGPEAEPSQGSAPDSSQAAAPGWEQLSLDEAIDRLITLNEQADPVAPMTQGQQLVIGGPGIASHGEFGPDGEAIIGLLVEETEVHLNPDETGYALVGTIRDNVSLGASAEELRRIVADSAVSPDDMERREAGETVLPGPYLDEAERLAVADTQPEPGQDDRPSQVAAFLTVQEIAPALYRPADRIRALRIIDTLDRGWLAYDGPVQDLLGREGVGIRAIDPANDDQYVIVFATDTGEVLGTWQEAPRDGRLVITGGFAIRVSEVRQTP